MSDLNTTINVLLSRHCNPGDSRYLMWFGKGQEDLRLEAVRYVVTMVHLNALHARYDCWTCVSRVYTALTLPKA